MAFDIGLGKVSRKIAQAIKRGQVNALKRALRKTRNKMVSDYVKDTGLPRKSITRRTKLIPPKKGLGIGFISVAIAFGIPLGEFKPITTMVKGAKRLYEGVTVRVGTLGRALVPKAWLWTARSGKDIVLQRDGSNRYPISTPKSDILRDVAKARQEEHKAYLAKVFKENYPIDIEDELK